MATYRITAPNGKVLNITGDEPPSEADLDSIFARVSGENVEQPKSKPTPTLQPKPQPQPKPTPAPKPIPKAQTQPQQKKYTGDYADILNNTSLTKEQKAEQIQARGEAERKKINSEKNKGRARITTGAVLQGASMHPIFNIPYVGTGIGGALFDAGSAIMEGKSGKDIAKQAGRGFVIGETISAIPYVGKAAAKTKAGQAVVGAASKVGQKLADTGLGKAVGKAATKTGEVLSKEIPIPFNKQKPVVTPQTVEQVAPMPTVEKKVSAEIVEPEQVDAKNIVVTPIKEKYTPKDMFPKFQLGGSKQAEKKQADIINFFENGGTLSEAKIKFKDDLYPSKDEHFEEIYNQYINYIKRSKKPPRVIKNKYDGTKESFDDILDDYESSTSTEKVGRGYSGYSMSKNAETAYNLGSKPISKWTKTNIINSIENINNKYDFNIDIEELKKMKSVNLKKLLKQDGYHHTSKFYNATDFYKVDLEKLKPYFRKPTVQEVAQAEVKSQQIIEPVIKQDVEQEIEKMTKASMRKEINQQLKAIKDSIEIPEITKGTYIKGRYKNRFYTKNVTDELTQDFIDADTVLANAIKEIKKNPEIINTDFDRLEQQIIKAIDGLPEEAQIQYYDKFWDAYAKAGDYNQLKLKNITPENLGYELEQPIQETVEQIPEGMNLRGGVKTIEKKFGKDVADQITDRTYEVRGKAVNKAEFEALAPEQQSQLINNADDSSDLATYAKAEYIKNRLANGEVPTYMLNNWVKGGTEKAQALQAQKWLAPDTVEGAMIKAQSAIRETLPKHTKDMLDNVDTIVKETAGKTEKEVEKVIKRFDPNKKVRKNIAQKIMQLQDDNALTPENVTNLLNKQYKVREINQTDINEFTKLTDNIRNAAEGRPKDKATAYLNKYIYKKILKPNLAGKIRLYRNMNMLLQGVSRTGDTVASTLNQGIRGFDEINAQLISKLTGSGVRSGRLYPKEYLTGLKKGWKEAWEDTKLGINTSGMDEQGRYDLSYLPEFEGTILEYPEKAFRLLVGGTDRAFKEGIKAASIADQMAAQGITKPTEEITKQALREGAEGTFTNESNLAKIFNFAKSQIDKKGTPLEILQPAQTLIPFVTTNANIATDLLKRMSGAQLLTGSRLLPIPKNPLAPKGFGATREAEHDFAKGLTALELGIPLGAWLYNQKQKGRTNIGDLSQQSYMGDDVTGLPAQGIMIGDNKAISLNRLGNITPLLAGYMGSVEGWKAGETLPEKLLNSITYATPYATNAILDFPGIKSIGDLTKDINKYTEIASKKDELSKEDYEKQLADARNKIIQNQVINAINQNIPFSGELGNIRNAVDPYRRELYSEDMLEYIANRTANRFPITSSTLPIKYNVIGEPSMSNNIQNPWLRTARALIDPFSISNVKPKPKSMTELDELRKYAMEHDIEGKTTLKYKTTPRKIKNKYGELKVETNKQRSRVQKVQNEDMYKVLEQIVNQEGYDNLLPEVKIELIKRVMEKIRPISQIKTIKAIKQTD